MSPSLITNIILIILFSFDIIFPRLILKKTCDIYLKNLPFEIEVTGFSMWTPWQSGYVLKTPEKVYIYLSDLTLLNQVSLEDSSFVGTSDLIVVNDTLLFLLKQGGYIEQYNSKSILLRRWWHSSGISGRNISVLGHKFAIAGIDRIKPSYYVPQVFIYDTLGAGNLIPFDNFYRDSILDLVNVEIQAFRFVSTNVTSYKEGFAVTTSIGHEVYLFSPEGKLQEVIEEKPPQYKSLNEAPSLDFKRSIMDSTYLQNWLSSWDFSDGGYGIRVINDTLLIVPRHNAGNPYFLDVYNLNQHIFLERLRSDFPVVGASNAQLYFMDIPTETTVVISAYRLMSDDHMQFPLPPDTLIDKKDCQGCSRERKRYSYIDAHLEKADMIDTVPAGQNKFALGFNNFAFEPDGLKRFCHSAKKNIFVFHSPTDFAGHLLIDTINAYLKNTDDWMFTNVVCYPNPLELNLYFLDLPGDRILVNRNVSIPDSTIALSDIGLPPIALAFSEGGEKFICGYSLGPRYDNQKKERRTGITFEEFLKECGIIVE